MRKLKPTRLFIFTVKQIARRAESPRVSFKAMVKEMEPEEMAARAAEIKTIKGKGDLDIFTLSEYYYICREYETLTGRPLYNQTWIVSHWPK